MPLKYKFYNCSLKLSFSFSTLPTHPHPLSILQMISAFSKMPSFMTPTSRNGGAGIFTQAAHMKVDSICFAYHKFIIHSSSLFPSNAYPRSELLSPLLSAKIVTDGLTRQRNLYLRLL